MARVVLLFAAVLANSANPQSAAQTTDSSGSFGIPTFVDPDSAAKPIAAVQPVAFVETQPNSMADDPAAQEASISIDSLPNTAGQIWRKYDLRPYTQRITTTQNPQQAVVDWILRETGTEMWFNEPLGVLSAGKDHLLVYHTPEIHAVVEKIVDRFLRTAGQPQVIGVRLMTVRNPNWRSGAYAMLQPIEVQSPGVEGWMITKENAALLINQLRRRSDYSEHSTGELTAHAGQKVVMNQTRPIDYTRAIRWLPGRFPGFETLNSRIDEGYSLDLSFLATPDGAAETLLRCDVDQVERLQSVDVDLPDNAGGWQTVRVGVPQLVSWRLHERFRWPADQVLLLSCGVVASPSETPSSGLQSLFGRARDRADALLMLEYKGPARGAAPAATAQGQLVPVQTSR